MTGKPVAPDSAAATTLRFAEKRELILDGAARLFNRRGIRAGTLAEVADSVGLATNSLTYYYRKKDDLVCACLLRSIEALEGIVDTAAAAAPAGDLAGRVHAVVLGFIALMAAIEQREHPALIFFSDMRALPQPQAAPAFAAYEAMFRKLRLLMHEGEAEAGTPLPVRGGAGRQALNARTHGLLQQLMWARAWLGRYESSDYARLASGVADLLLHGLAAPGQTWPAGPLPALPALPDSDELREAYLRTATQLINDHGVGGASVERIAARLALTKGSFYHHHETKEALIDDCFERSFTLIRGVQLAALATPGNGWHRLLAATLPLVALLGSPRGPLLRLTAWTELPGALRWQKFGTMNRLGERFAAMVVDGMIDGSIRLVDPALAAQMIGGLINGLAEVEHWVPGADPATLQDLLARPLLTGLLADNGQAGLPAQRPTRRTA